MLLLDRDLPGMSGDEICQAVVRAGLAGAVVFVTASNSERDRAAGLALGADTYIGKPFAFAALLACVRTLVSAGH